MHVTLIKAFLDVCSVARLVTGAAGARQARSPKLRAGPQVQRTGVQPPKMFYKTQTLIEFAQLDF